MAKVVMNGGDGMSGEGDVWLTEALIAAGSIRGAGKSGLVEGSGFIDIYLELRPEAWLVRVPPLLAASCRF